MKYIYTFLIITSAISCAFSQDAHYSLYQYAPLYLNPALTGQIPTTNRLVLNYRGQWSAIENGYRNIGATYDRKTNNSGWGLLLNRNDAGEASLSHTNVYFNYALGRNLTKRNRISLGIQGGITQRSFDPTKFTFDAQYGANGFDATRGSGENFTRTSVMVPDFNIGFAYQLLRSENSKFNAELGFAFSHLNTPDIAMTEGGAQDLPIKRLLNAKIGYQINEKFELAPRLLFMNHYTANEISYGLSGRYAINPKNYLNFGFDIRQDDALIVSAGIERRNFILAASFDATNSTLQNPVNGQGAFELALILLFDQGISKPKIPFISNNSNGDRDGDGILDRVDKCPDVPGLVKLEGCPESNNKDRDGDGIINELDKCPDIVGVFRLEGCPDDTPQRPVQKDTDGDGVFDDIDLCPTVPGLPQYRGCNDYDKDGVYDNVDVCPRIYGHPSNYGCPIDERSRDSDGDGILDKDDKCVYLRGLPAFNGCPDTDGDGISDVLDDCPFLKGPEANNGCPVNQAGTTTLPNNPAEISIDVVEFDLDKSFVRPEYFTMLNRVANIMLQNPSYKIMLVGHTDFEGSATYNYQLGQRRSIAVREFLIKNGVSPERIQVMSYGEELPKKSNTSDDGRQRNRRTEIIIMDNYDLPKYDSRN